MLDFEKVIPEDVGISSTGLISFARKLEYNNLPMHSIIVMRHGKICMESYYAPYTKDTLHRMFSVTKSFVSLAIGLLADEGRISLDDHIADYFPEKQPETGVHPYMQMLTIRQMLTMRTCHDVNAYKIGGSPDWVGSFFTVTPDHVPGTNFSYDTASTHTLGALVEKLTGMELLDYLRTKFLDELEFSKEAFILKSPDGKVSMGGSGMCATPRDILKVMYVVSQNGKLDGKQLLPSGYLKEATVKQSDPYGKSGSWEEMQGYGYQIWMTTHNGYAFFGMGGQLAVYYPDKDVILVTTADAQGRQGGVQLIYDTFYEEVYSHIDTCTDNGDYKEFQKFENSRQLLVEPGEYSSDLISKINGQSYEFDTNPCGVTDIKLTFNGDEGTFFYTNATGNHELHFGLGKNVFQNFPDYNFKCGASAAFRADNNLLIKVQIIDSSVGNMYISLSYIDDYVTVMMRKLEESYFNEYDGVFSGKLSI